ncbi:DNA polymerase epsilon catalytic subunit [Allomyces arbusculus]|nr:DNA polymerase epsilon catalytic subunit [Allomyces arbusculus]
MASRGKGTFGLVPNGGKSGGKSGGGGGGQGRSRFPSSRRAAGGNNFKGAISAPELDENGLAVASAAEQQFQRVAQRDELDVKMGFSRFDAGPPRSGWMVNMHPTLLRDDDWPGGRSACDYYFIQDDGSTFKSTIKYSPYFYIMCKPGSEPEVEEFLRKKYESTIEKIEMVDKEDLDQPNHLLGIMRRVVKLLFRNVQDLLRVRKDVLAAVRRAKASTSENLVFDESMNVQVGVATKQADKRTYAHDPMTLILDIREYDVPYYLRVAMDRDYRVGVWYNVVPENGVVSVTRQEDKLLPADPVVLAFDIETTKLPLKFPDASHDQIMMISYMIDGQGYLITNREIVSEDIADFEYNPKPEFPGPFVIFNEVNEEQLIRRFFEHVVDVQPQVFVTYNGDFFDWPFVEARAKAHGLDMYEEIGVFRDDNDEYKSYYAHHSDCFRWVKRDSYLPAGSHGLKAVTTAKLGYNPMELDPEVMLTYAQQEPQILAQYSVSDAVATYYLYMKYVHPFVFSLCNIIPMNPDEVLRKGSGTLCESLLMVQAFKANVLMPNKHVDEVGKFYQGHLLTAETYVGGHVEALEAGVFRSDIATTFKIVPSMIDKLINDVDRALRFTLEVEHKVSPDDVIDLDEKRDQIIAALQGLRDQPNRLETPLIYHLDVAAMYPNIILTNRLQPDAMVSEATCATCDFNAPENQCKRPLEWSWRGEYFPATHADYNMILGQLAKDPVFRQLSKTDRQAKITKTLADYSRKVYKKLHDHEVVQRTSTVCQRENPFYIDTVRQFRDRRYEYKGLLKVWKKNLEKAQAASDTAGINEGKKMVVVMDSLQLAHKCILNSFYGYVMRKGSRWYSMEMGGIVCYTGAQIIQLARELIEQVGRPLELDTDGIWCILPKSFPENFVCTTKTGKKCVISYPCTMLNHLVYGKFTNHQYQSRKDRASDEWEIRSENSILFEVDGPYRAMILPASTEADKLLKKRYAVFNDNGSLAELKGFEVKRRGELKLIKIFQQQIFSVFLEGSTLEECYAAVARVANQWLDIMDTRGANMPDSELIDLISENKNMSKSLSEYEGQKSTAITTAKRLAMFLGNDMVKDKLACHFLIAKKPVDAPVAERAIPVAILHTDPAIRRHFLRKWLKDPNVQDPDIRDLIDWDYYKERFGFVLQKLITIPAAMQKVPNPIPRVKHPDWLRQRVNNERHQTKLTELFDMEDLRKAGAAKPPPRDATAVANPARTARVTRVNKRKTAAMEMDELKEALLAAVCPNPTQDYHGWLQYQKKKWKYQRLAAKHRAHEAASASRAAASAATSSGTTSSGTNQMDAFLRAQQASLESSKWSILQVKEGKGGAHQLWVLIGDKLHQITLRIPRTFYVKSRVQMPIDQMRGMDEVTVTEVKKYLPRKIDTTLDRQEATTLYQCSMDEEVFKQNERMLMHFFSHPKIEGVYEASIPGTFRAVLQLGATCIVARKMTGNVRNVTWSQLQIADSSDYLQADTVAALDDLFLYHLSVGDRHFVILYSFRATQECHVLVSDPSGKDNVGNVDSVYHRLVNAMQERDPAFALPAVTFNVTSHRSESVLLVALNKLLAVRHRERPTPTMLTIQSNKASVLEFVKAIQLFPYTHRAPHLSDADLPALDWQRTAFRSWFTQVAYLGDWKTKQLDLARFTNVPLGNLTTDSHSFAIDVLLARRLVKAEYVLWYSSESRPDLGGRQDDEHFSVLDAHMALPEVNAPGMYPTVTMDLHVEGLSVAACLELQHTELDPLASLVRDLILQAARVKKGEAPRIDNQLADALLIHLDRWLTNSAAYLYDPKVAFMVFNGMKRVFMSLISELKKLGTSIVFGSFHRLVVNTPKASVAQGHAFVDFLIQHLNGPAQFASVLLTPTRTWTQLSWMDPFNYAGFLLPERRQTVDKDGNTVPLPPPTADPIALEMQWNIAEFLPEQIVPVFHDILGDFLTDCYECRPADHAVALSSASGPNEAWIQSKRALVQTKYKRRLLQLVPRFQRSEHGVDGMTFPSRLGAHLALTSPTLEFVKDLVTIMALDPDIDDAVRILRRNLLDVLRVREFAPEAQFANPCLPLVVPHVVCMACNATADLDFTRDPTLRGLKWACARCGAAYSKVDLEARLLDMVENAVLAHQVQDLVCSKCHLVKRENLNAHCGCSGAFVLAAKDGRTAFVRKVQVIAALAVMHGMEYLREVCEYAMGLVPMPPAASGRM